ncbi:hemerythrin domain-containing protein [Aeromicrobium sp. 636]|uniref:Hemerythrin domain-containing protein n=1 Tax=Aeromicrobium senzhongii TaxID=2663859 RepID=A0A8I0EXZ8_9ACTN|nr:MULTISPECIES: hemerythrin domain-containing protein [Aeromicrobium]MBC9227240.1 hemerythrin domain-containing protein [Aeromicrobium senzhongii]MCQ3999339.1 hemerythrin domain-containing protein [Aeromicrobium sp. 636]
MSPTPLLLPGQAASPPGPADMTMMYVLHHAFRRDVQDFAHAAEQMPTGERDRWVLLADRWQLFTHELHQHHTKEDEILWPLLLDRVRAAGDAEAERVLHEMEAEHAVLDPLLAAATAAFERLSAGGDDRAHDLLRDTLGELGAVLGHHLGHEESAAIEILQRYVGGNEWHELERTRFRTKQTLAEARWFVPWALKGLPAEAEHRVLTLAGPPLRIIHAVSKRRFRSQEQEAFGVLDA